jgi:hypothetical protein
MSQRSVREERGVPKIEEEHEEDEIEEEEFQEVEVFLSFFFNFYFLLISNIGEAF